VTARATRYVLVPAIFSTVILVVASFLWKSRCTGPTFAAPGSSPVSLDRATGDVCWSDIQLLWGARDLISHAFPYVHGVFVPPSTLTGAVEYPVLAGVWIWVTSLPAVNDAQFLLINAVTLGICAVIVTVLLVRAVGVRALLWAAVPAMFFYSVYNWDLLSVLVSVVGLTLLLRGPRAWSLRARVIVACVLFGIGGDLKLYPILFVLPVVAWLLQGAGRERRGRPDRESVVTAIWAIVAGGGTMLVINIPFMLVNFAGWKSAIDFQSYRALTSDTMSTWYLVLRRFGEPSQLVPLTTLNIVTSATVAVGVAALLIIGWRIGRRIGVYPWLAVSTAIIAAYMLLSKVDSPQYIMWLIPLLLLSRIPIPVVLAYYVVDAVLFVTWFKSIHNALHAGPAWWWQAGFDVASWARVVLLVVVIVLAMRQGLRRRTVHDAPTDDAPPALSSGAPVAA